MPKLLKEYISDLIYPQKQLLERIEDPKADLIFENCILQRADTPNQNKRIYPKHIMEKEIENYKQLIREKRALGTIDHPEKSVVELKESCWIVTDIWWSNLEVRGNLKVLRNHPCGKIIEGLVKDGVTIGVSSRALGEIERDSSGQYDVVQTGLVLVSFDAVAEPSTKNAFVNSQNITESVEKFLRDNEHFSDEYIIQKMLNNLICGKDSCEI